MIDLYNRLLGVIFFWTLYGSFKCYTGHLVRNIPTSGVSDAILDTSYKRQQATFRHKGFGERFPSAIISRRVESLPTLSSAPGSSVSSPLFDCTDR